MAVRPSGKNQDRRRLQVSLAVLFVALAVPTAAVIWQAYSRLEWESFHQYRTQAEELTRRIDRGLAERIAEAGSRRFADYAFVNVGGDPAAGVLQRSTLAAFPVEQQLPGLIGYFQVDADGSFSTPLLPAAGTDPASVGIGAEEYRARLALTEEIRKVLADNRLVGARTPGPAPLGEVPEPEESLQESAASLASFDADEGAEKRAKSEGLARRQVKESYGQQAFDELSEPVRRDQPVPAGSDTALSPEAKADARTNAYGKVQDLQLDDALIRKSEVAEEAESTGDGKAGASGPADIGDLRITTFESEVDPFEFSLLDSGHFVLFRKVWRDGERFIQGILIERRAFLGEVESAFRSTALSAMSDLALAYRDDVIELVPGSEGERYPDASGMRGALLYRDRLSAPLDALELIYSISRLPPGPGAAVLGWTTLLLGAVFIGGFLALYRLGMGQIRLARQQQDFVSAVSHELKTPLTSIRMYGEMLKEGWADEARRKQYYEYIHDESERLGRLIDNVLRLSSITRNGPSIDLHSLTAGELIDKVRSRISSQVERAGFEITFSVDEDARRAEVLIDEDCFLQIVINLVDNAIKFSKKADAHRIDITAMPESNRRVRFAVRDYGPGVPREQMKKIFGLFYRTESELTRESVGTGIGLAIVHQLTTAMSGKVDVVNRDPGAEFRLSFPARSG
jgi:signal transduction histidine kinase